MNKKVGIIFISLLWICIECGEKDDKDTVFEVPVEVDTVICADWGNVIFDEYILENNVWGKGVITNYLQCIFYKDIEDQNEFGWEWTWPSSGSNVKAYPEIIYGHKPWSLTSTTPSLPLKISDVQSISLILNSDLTASGSFNLAYDIWITTTNVPSENVISREIMIWLTNNQLMPAGEKIETVIIDEVNYDLYQHTFPGWEYIAFLPHEPLTSTTIKFERFVNTLIDFKLLEETEFIASIEFGNEIVDGSGNLIIHQYEISVNP